MNRSLLLFVAVAFVAACLPLETRQSAITSADEALAAVAEMAEDKGWTVTSASDTAIVARERSSDDDDELIFTVTVENAGTQLTLNVHRVVGGFGEVFVEDRRYYDEFFDELAVYQ